MKRRDVLKRTAAVGVGTTIAASGTASATHASDDGRAVDVPPGWSKGIAVEYAPEKAMDVPFFTYMGSVYVDDLCDLGISTCVISGPAAGYIKYLGGSLSSLIMGSLCAGIASGCKLKDLIRRVDDDMAKWADFYVSDSGTDKILIPRSA